MKFMKYFFIGALLTLAPLSADLNVRTSINHTNGDAVTAFEDFDGVGNNIFASIQSVGFWSISIPIGDPLTSPSHPLTAMNNAGEMAIIWQGYDLVNFASTLYGSFYIGGTWVTSQISDPTLEHVIGNYELRLSDAGQVVVTWSSYIFASGTYQARGSYSPTFGSWGTLVTIP